MKTVQVMLTTGLAWAMGICATSAWGEQFKIEWASATESAGAFHNAAKWINEKGETVTTTPSAGNTYLIENQRLINAGQWGSNPANYTFGGDSLQIGVLNEWRGGEFMHDGYGTLTINNLILASGIYKQWKSEAGKSSAVMGTTKVISPTKKPFCICAGWFASGWTVNWGSALTSDTDDVAVMVGAPIISDWADRTWPSCSATVRFTGDNSAYRGSIIANGAKAKFQFASAASLGGKPSAFNAKGLVMQNGVTVIPEGNDITLSSDVDRGLYVGSGGGTLNIASGKKLRVEWPIAGTGDLTVTGGGELTLDSATAARITVAAGTLMLGKGFSNTAEAPLVIDNAVALAVPAGEEAVVAAAELDNLTIQVSYDAATEKSGVVVLANDYLPTKPMTVIVPNVRQIKVPFFKTPVGARTLTADSFVEPLDLVKRGLPSAVFTVETEGDYQVAYVETAELITGDFSAWSDGKAMHAKGDYVLPSTNTWKTWKVDTATYALPGESLKMYGSHAKGNQMTWYLYCNDFTGDVRLGERTAMQLQPNTGNEMHIRGRMDISNSLWSDNGLRWVPVKKDITMVFDSVLTGSGALCIEPNYQWNAGNATFYFTNTNTYNGVIFLYSNASVTTNILKFATAESFGTNPASKQAQGFKFQARSILYPMGSQSVSLPNKEFYIFNTDMMHVRVDENEKFELNAPITMCKDITVTKVGGGTWAVQQAVGVSSDATGSSTPKLAVAEGYLRPDVPKAFEKVIVTFADKTGLVAKYRPGETSDLAKYGMMVTDASRLVVAGDVLKFKVDLNGATLRKRTTIPVLTVPASLASTLDAKTIKIEVEDSKDHWFVHKDAVTIGDVDYVRYSVSCEKGMVYFIW